MPYPSRPTLPIDPRFVGTAGVRQTPEQREALIAFAVQKYEEGFSLRQIGELTGRTQPAVRRALDQGGVRRRTRGAYPLGERHGRSRSEDFSA